MTREGLQRALIDLGWISILQRVLGGRPAESCALRQLMTRPGRVISYADFAENYAARANSDAYGASPRINGHMSTDAVRTRVGRLRRALEDLGLPRGAIRNVHGHGYVMDPAIAVLVERTILQACGIELESAP